MNMHDIETMWRCFKEEVDKISARFDESSGVTTGARNDSANRFTKTPVRWVNGCNQSVPEALRYLANNDRPIGGEETFNSAHLYQLADEIESMAQYPLYRESVTPEMFNVEPQIADLKYGPEPSLREIIHFFYADQIKDQAKAAEIAENYIEHFLK